MQAPDKKYFLQQFLQNDYFHGGIGCVDAEKVLLANGYQPVLFPHQRNFSFKAKLGRALFLAEVFFSITKPATIVFIFPSYGRMDKWLICLLNKKKNTRMVCLIADIDGLKDGNPDLLNKEIRFFQHFRYFIVHNERMQQWLKTKIPESKSGIIEFFDFLTKPLVLQRQISYEIAFAGNLEKSGFLKHLHLLEKESPRLHFHLYGEGITQAMTDQAGVTYHGVSAPYDMPGKLQGSFGLVWDGESIDGTGGGSMGDYMQYISHHKLSLYIVSKLPLIVPASAASAPLIEKYGIGIVVNSLYEIQERISALTTQQYTDMQNNMFELAEKISKGQCLEEALARLSDHLQG